VGWFIRFENILAGQQCPGMIKLWFKKHMEQKDICSWLLRAMSAGFNRKELWCWIGILDTFNDEKLPELQYKAMLDSIEKRRERLIERVRSFEHYKRVCADRYPKDPDEWDEWQLELWKRESDPLEPQVSRSR
jgi:hypothetical protein